MSSDKEINEQDFDLEDMMDAVYYTHMTLPTKA